MFKWIRPKYQLAWAVHRMTHVKWRTLCSLSKFWTEKREKGGLQSNGSCIEKDQPCSKNWIHWQSKELRRNSYYISEQNQLSEILIKLYLLRDYWTTAAFPLMVSPRLNSPPIPSALPGEPIRERWWKPQRIRNESRRWRRPCVLSSAAPNKTRKQGTSQWTKHSDILVW